MSHVRDVDVHTEAGYTQMAGLKPSALKTSVPACVSHVSNSCSSCRNFNRRASTKHVTYDSLEFGISYREHALC